MRASSPFPAGLGYKMNMGDVGSEGVLMVGWVGDKQHKPFLIYDCVQTNHALHIASQREANTGFKCHFCPLFW